MTDDTLMQESEALVKQLVMMVDFTDDRAQRPRAMTDAVIAFARAKQERIEQLEAERGEANRKLRDVCMAHGPALIEIHDLKEERDRLLKEVRKLDALEAMGVDNWGGYSDAMQYMEENP